MLLVHESHSWKTLVDGRCFVFCFSPVVLCSRTLQEQFVRGNLEPCLTSAELGMEAWHGTEVCPLHVLCGQHFTSTSDLVVLITRNLPYCRCGVANLPGPLSHIPKFRTARQPAHSSANQGRRVLCAFCRWEMTVAPRNAHCPLWVRARLQGVTSRCDEACNVNFTIT